MLRNWDDLPEFMKCDEVRVYYDILSKKKKSLVFKRIFDIIAASIMLIVLAIPMLVIGILIKIDSTGPIFYRQERVTIYGKVFRIHKFRTMISDADKIGATVTVAGDSRITKIGKTIRDYRIDEIPQLIDVLFGNMSFVGTRPEAVKYVKQYTKEMNATLLLPAGITSNASIQYKDEAALLNKTEDIDTVYVKKILPDKMKYNLDDIKNYSFINDIKTMFQTVIAVLGKN